MKGHRAHIVVGLLVEGSVLALVMMVWLWGIVALGSQTVVRETHSPMAQSAPKYVAVCHAPDTSKKGAALGAAGDEGRDCPPKDWPHTTTSRQPGTGLAKLNQLEDS